MDITFWRNMKEDELPEYLDLPEGIYQASLQVEKKTP